MFVFHFPCWPLSEDGSGEKPQQSGEKPEQGSDDIQQSGMAAPVEPADVEGSEPPVGVFIMPEKNAEAEEEAEELVPYPAASGVNAQR